MSYCRTEPIEVETLEQKAVLDAFGALLRSVTADGGRKRAAGLKPPWWRDGSHRAAIFSHLNKYEHGERRDPDSGAHPFVHLAWRALAIAYQETVGLVDPDALCVFCRGPLGTGPHYGAGDGSGRRFSCAPCWEKRRDAAERRLA